MDGHDSGGSGSTGDGSGGAPTGGGGHGHCDDEGILPGQTGKPEAVRVWEEGAVMAKLHSDASEGMTCA